MNSTEPLLQDNKDRFVIFPVKHHDIWDWYKKMEACFWTAEEIDLNQDINDWNNKLSQDERFFLKHILTSLASSERIKNKNPEQNFAAEVKYPEARFFFEFQAVMENIHSETFSLLLNTCVQDDKEKDKLYNTVQSFPAIQKKAEWALKWGGSDSFAERLIALTALKGIFSSGAFCSIFWMKKRGLMPGLTFANELIARDEAMYGDFAIHLYNYHIVNKVPKQLIREIVLDAVKIEKEFFATSLAVSQIGMNQKLMDQYLGFITDRLLTSLDCEKEFNTSNPFEFMDLGEQQDKTRFFEKRAEEFQKTGIVNNEKDTNKINFNAGF